jgi:outer membrane protein assembly factor BamB
MPGLRKLRCLLMLFFALALLRGKMEVASGSGIYDWLQFNGDPQHSGNNTQEIRINRYNVAALRVQYQVALNAWVDSTPAFLHGVVTAQGVKDLLFMDTAKDGLIAVDAQTGALAWSQPLGPGDCTMNNDGATPCWTTSSVAVDPNKQFVYSYGLDGYVHKYQVGDGVEIKDEHWPEVTTLKGFDEKGSANLSIATAKNGISYLYVAHSGYPSDGGDYQGHVTAINLSSGAQQVFNVLCSDQIVHFVSDRPGYPGNPDCQEKQAGVWARSGVVYDPDVDRIFFATGNGYFDGNLYWGNSILALHPDGSGSSGKPVDSYTPVDWPVLRQADMDLGSTPPVILPPLPGSSYAHLAVQGGKDSTLRFVNLDDLSGKGGPGNTGGEIGAPLQLYSVSEEQPEDELHTAPAVWTNPEDGSVWIFVVTDSHAVGLKILVQNGIPEFSRQWEVAQGGSSPLVANGVLFYAGSTSQSTGGIWALNPTTGEVLWSANLPGAIHWESPIVANGVVYMVDYGSNLTAFVPPPLDKHVYLPLIAR